jgi:hypothetical protein
MWTLMLYVVLFPTLFSCLLVPLVWQPLHAAHLPVFVVLAVFVPFAFVEAAANVLTNPALDPFGKIPEFKFCGVRVEPADAPVSSPGYGVAADARA